MNDDEVIETAIRILEKRVREGDCLASPQAVREYLRLRIGDREREIFVVVLLDAQHRVIAVEELFAGTLTQTSVYPREVVKCVLRHNAAAVVLAQSRDCKHQPADQKALLNYINMKIPAPVPAGRPKTPRGRARDCV